MGNQNTFGYSVTVTAADIDQLNHANNVVYLRWAQEAAEAHWNFLSDMNTRANNAWVVVRHEIDYKYPALLHDRLSIKTWVGETAGVRSVRYVEIFNGSAQLSAAVKTTWCLVDPQSLKPKRIDAGMMRVLFGREE